MAYHFHRGEVTDISGQVQGGGMSWYPSGGDEERNPHDAILAEIGPGSMTKSSVVNALSDEYEDREIKVALAELIDEGEVVEHPRIDGAWRNPDAH